MPTKYNLIDNSIVSLGRLTVTGADSMEWVLSVIKNLGALKALLQEEDRKHANDSNKG